MDKSSKRAEKLKLNENAPDEGMEEGSDFDSDMEGNTSVPSTSFSGARYGKDAGILPLRKTIMVGSDYQVNVPENIPNYDVIPANDAEDKLLWNPYKYKITDDQIEQYLRILNKLRAHIASSLPCGSHTRDDERALFLLLRNNHNMEKALHDLLGNLDEKPRPWTEEECKNFESGLRLYGKDFFSIKHSKVPSRSVGDLVHFYYLWKKTERHDVFANRGKLEKKKYSLHPGVTFLDDPEEVGTYRDNTLSNIQCLIYGDPKRFPRNFTNQLLYDNPKA